MDDSRPTLWPVQYSLRALLVMMTVVCVLCAVFAPFVRAMSPANRQDLAWYLMTIVSASALYAAWMCRRRWKAETRSGKRILSVPSRTAKGLVVTSLLWPVVILGVGVYFALSEFGFLVGCAFGVQAGLLPIHLLLPLYWDLKPGGFEICENGIVFDAIALHRWDTIRGYSWQTGGKNVLVFRLRFFVRNIKIPSELRDEVQQLLEEHLPGTVVT